MQLRSKRMQKDRIYVPFCDFFSVCGAPKAARAQRIYRIPNDIWDEKINNSWKILTKNIVEMEKSHEKSVQKSASSYVISEIVANLCCYYSTVLSQKTYRLASFGLVNFHMTYKKQGLQRASLVYIEFYL